MSDGANLTKTICRKLIDTHREYGWRAEKEALFSPRRIDVLAISPGAFEVIGFEIKTSIADFRNELKNPAKRQAVANHCTQFYFAVPRGMVNPSDVPEDCGLLYYQDGWVYIAKPSPSKKHPLVFEIEIDDYWEWDAVLKEAELRELREIRENGLIAESDAFDWFTQLPKWLLPRTLKPLRFQFDVIAAASKLCSSFLPHHDIDFEGIPF